MSFKLQSFCQKSTKKVPIYFYTAGSIFFNTSNTKVSPSRKRKDVKRMTMGLPKNDNERVRRIVQGRLKKLGKERVKIGQKKKHGQWMTQMTTKRW